MCGVVPCRSLEMTSTLQIIQRMGKRGRRGEETRCCFFAWKNLPPARPRERPKKEVSLKSVAGRTSFGMTRPRSINYGSSRKRGTRICSTLYCIGKPRCGNTPRPEIPYWSGKEIGRQNGKYGSYTALRSRIWSTQNLPSGWDHWTDTAELRSMSTGSEQIIGSIQTPAPSNPAADTLLVFLVPPVGGSVFRYSRQVIAGPAPWARS